MRKALPIYLALAIACLFTNLELKAAPGDTTWVQAQNNVQLGSHGNFDLPVNFPNGSTSYYKVLMVFTLGKYQCAAGDQYCGDWDYTVLNYLMTPTDTVELSRLITPYANASYPRTGWNMKQRYYADVTDFMGLLKNTATVRIQYDGWSWGFTANIRFAFIEGTPPRPILGVTKLFNGYYDYGNPADPIDGRVVPVSVTAPANTQFAEMRFLITGHGSDNNGCSEFCYPTYFVKQNNGTIASKQLLKNCGINNLYAQSGTWIYNRANWCPGEGINVDRYKFPNVTGGTTYSADIDWQSYTRTASQNPPGYYVSGYMVHYGAWARAVDAGIEQIVAPSTDENNFRANPVCGSPVIDVKNLGSTPITSLQISYGVVGQTAQTYTYSTLTINPGDVVTLTLPNLTALTSLGPNATGVFTATITQVNGAADGYSPNNTMKSEFNTSPVWPKDFNLVFRTNTVGADTRWKIEDMSGNTLFSKTPTSSEANTLFSAPISITTNGCYKLTVTDNTCDGLYFWGKQSLGAGYIFAQAADGSQIPFTNGLLQYPSSNSSDFGCGFTQYFRVTSNVVTAINTPSLEQAVVVTPNPFQSNMLVEVQSLKSYKATIKLIDSRGREVRNASYPIHQGRNMLKLEGLSDLASGTYLMILDGEAGRVTRKVIKN